MITAEEVLRMLQAKAKPDQVQEMARFGMTEEGRLGLSIPDLRAIAKSLGKNHPLAQELWKTRIAEARILASMIAEPGKLTDAEMDSWVADFNSWDVCDQVCMNLFDKSPLAWKKIPEWSERDEEFTRRAALALIACLAWHDKQAQDAVFIELMPTIKQCATDERNFVKKAASWALRNVGKRNPLLNQIALQWARDIQQINSKAARWIAADAIRELESEAVLNRL